MYTGEVLVVDHDSYHIVHSAAHWVVVMILAVRVYREQSEVRACSSVLW